MWSVEIGKQSEWISCGNTNVSVQYMHSKNSWINRDSGSAWGVAAVQHMDRANTELYAAVRTFDYKNDFQSYDNIWAMMVGLRVKFSAGL